ncbi:hypothetical protein [Streptomyces bacillaris]|uniref:hypothetical protein n=1 Tax=Streptomyces bacillaris TaxID=68179 RepID=UPI003EC12B24
MSRFIYGEDYWATEGPYKAWTETETELTDAIRQDLGHAVRERRTPTCPTCGQPVETAENESVTVQREMYGDFDQIGSLTTLQPCGHRFAVKSAA